MYKTSFDPIKEKLHDKVSLWLVRTLISNKFSLHSQYIKGTTNIIEKYLSSYFHISDESLTNILKNPPTTDIYAITRQTSSWIYYLLNNFSSSIFDMTKGISKSTAANEYVKWDKW